MRFTHRDRHYEAIVECFSIADPSLLYELHLNPEKTPNILATFSVLGRPEQHRHHQRPFAVSVSG